MFTNKALMFSAAVVIASIAIVGCTSSPQAREAKFLKRGKELLEKKDFGRALLEFKNAAQVMPKDAEPYYQIGLTHLAIQDLKYAVAAFNKALELDPKHSGAQLKLAELEANSGNPNLISAATTRLEAIVAAAPEDLEAVDALAAAKWRLGKTDVATELLEQALAKFPASLGSSLALERVKLRQYDLNGAEAVLKKAVDSDPRSSMPVLALGRLYVILHQTEKAESAFRKALELDPQNGSALLSLAAIQLAANRSDQAEQSLRQLASFPDGKYSSVHAIFLYQTGKREAALAELEKLAKDHPDDRNARARLLQAYLEMNRSGQAEGLLAAALKKNPKDSGALLQQGQLYLRSGRLDEAQRDLNQVLHFAPTSVPAHLALAGLYRAQGKPLMERQELGEALRLNPAYSGARLQLAASFLAGDDPASALRLLDAAPPAQKKTLEWTIERNRLLFALHKTKELREALDAVLPSVRLPEFVLQDALLKLAARDYAGARADAEEVLKEKPEDSTAAAVIGDSYFAQKQPDKAIERLTQIVAAHPNSAPLQYVMGDFYARAKNSAGARKAWMSAKAADVRFIKADVALSELDLREKNPDQARQRLLSAVQTAPADVSARVALARIDEISGNATEAVANYRIILSMDERNLFALNNLACHLALENPDEGLKFAQRAIEIAPGNAEVEDTIGWIFYRKGVYSTATHYLKDAFSKDPSPQREFHLAMSYLKSGESDLGSKTLNAALRKDPNLPKTEKGW